MFTPKTSSLPSLRAARAVIGLASLLGLAVALPGHAQPGAQQGRGADYDTSYGYLRVVEGSATLTQGSTGKSGAAEINVPILAGDRLQVAPRGRAEVVLADHNLVRLDGGSVLLFDKLAASADRNDPSTVLRLDEGNVELVVTQGSLGKELPTVVTPNASVYVQAYGTYRITSDRGDWSQVVVRRGTVQVVADSGEQAVRADEEAVVDSESRSGNGGVEIRAAGGYDALERWGRGLDDETRVADDRYVDDSLRYQAAPLNRYGHWIDVDNQEYWQPNNVDEGWHPFWEGHWQYTPSGQDWVPEEPWGYVPYHYGSWDYLPSYGWAWQPGYSFSPAWVYWYWGPSYVGWCPIGYYTHFYQPFFRDPCFRFGIYGWAGGGFAAFSRWNFVAAFDFGRHDLRRCGVPISRIGVVARGIITTDTRAITPAVLRDPGGAVRALANNPVARALPGTVGGRLPDVSSFVARQSRLEPAVARAVVADGPRQARSGVGVRIAGSPLQPSTLGSTRVSSSASGPTRSASGPAGSASAPRQGVTSPTRAFGGAPGPGSSPPAAGNARGFRAQPMPMPAQPSRPSAPAAQPRTRQEPAPARPPHGLDSAWSPGRSAIDTPAGTDAGRSASGNTDSYRSRFRADHPSESGNGTPGWTPRLRDVSPQPARPQDPQSFRAAPQPSYRRTPPPVQRDAPPSYHSAAPSYRSSPPSYRDSSPYSAPPSDRSAPPAPRSYRSAPPSYRSAPPSDQSAPPSYRSYRAPEPSYRAPAPTYRAPAPSYRSSAPSYHSSPPPQSHSSSSSRSSSSRGNGSGGSNKHRGPGND